MTRYNITKDIFYTQNDKRSALYRFLNADNARIYIDDNNSYSIEYLSSYSERISNKALDELERIIKTYYRGV